MSGTKTPHVTGRRAADRRLLRRHRPGDGLYGESIVALDLTPVNGMALPDGASRRLGLGHSCAPILRHHRRRKTDQAMRSHQARRRFCSLASPSPVWPIEERPCGRACAGRVVREDAAVCDKPPPYDRQGVSVDDLIDFTPAPRRRVQLGVALQDRPHSSLHRCEQVTGRCDLSAATPWRPVAWLIVRSGTKVFYISLTRYHRAGLVTTETLD